MRLQLEIPGLALADITPEELATAVARLIEGGIELPDGMLYPSDVRVTVFGAGGEFPAPVPAGPDAGNSPSLCSET